MDFGDILGAGFLSAGRSRKFSLHIFAKYTPML